MAKYAGGEERAWDPRGVWRSEKVARQYKGFNPTRSVTWYLLHRNVVIFKLATLTVYLRASLLNDGVTKLARQP